VAPLAERFVRVTLDARGFKSDLKKVLSGPEYKTLGERAGKDWAAGFKSVVKSELAATKYRVKVEADWSGFKNPPGVPNVRSSGSSSPSAPKTSGDPASSKIPVELDPLVANFQADLRKQLAALSKQVSAKVPVSPETAGLRQDLADKIRILEQQLKVKVPAGPEARGFETDLRALAKEVESQIRIHVPVEADGAAAATKKAVAEASAAARGAKIPIELDPLVSQFQANVRRELAGLRRLSAQIPVNPDTSGLRRDVSLRIAAIEKTLKIKIPVDAGNKDSFVSGLTGELGNLKGVLGGALGVAPQALQALSGGFDAVSGTAQKAAGSASSFGSSLSGLAGPIGTALTVGVVAIAISALPAVALAASGAIIALGGALASLPALGVGLGASIGALGLGFEGISDHLKPLPKAAGGGAKALSQVASATRGVTNAQRDLLKATKDIDKARKDEIERIDDLGRSLRGAVLDEEDAAAGVAAARTKLAEARGSGDVNAIGEADRAYRRSLLTLDDARDKTGDLQQEKAKADQDGVEGSDQVQQALERQRDAVDRLKSAQESLADAQKSAGGAASAALAKLKPLAPAAQEVVDAIKRLKPAWEDLRLTVQQKLFEGVGAEIEGLAKDGLPTLKNILGSYATEFNGLFKNLSGSVRKPEFLTNIGVAAESSRGLIDKLGKAITGPFMDAFGRLAAGATPFIDMLGDKLAGVVEHFSAWIKSADESGKLSKFFEDAAFYFGKLWDIGGNLVGIFTDLFGIFFDTPNQGGAKDYLSGLNDQLVSIRDWLKDPDNQKKIKEWISDFGDFVKKMQELATFITEKVLPALSSLMGFISDVKNKIDEWREKWKSLRETLTTPISFSGIFDSIKDAFKGAVNWIINKWNTLHFSIPGFSVPFVGSFGGTSVGVGYIKPFAKGGVVQPRPGGIVGRIGEAGEPEGIAPVSTLQGYIADAVTSAIGPNAGGPIIVEAHIYLDGRELERTVVETIGKNPDVVAKANASGSKRRAYAG
jgi:hypothetical protein